MPYEPTTNWEGYFEAALSPGASFAGGLAAMGGIAGALGAGGPQAMASFANKLADSRNMEVSQAWAQFQKEEERRFQAQQADEARAHDKAMQAQGHTNAMALQQGKFDATQKLELLEANAALVSAIDAAGGPQSEVGQLALNAIGPVGRKGLGAPGTFSSGDIGAALSGSGGASAIRGVLAAGGFNVGATMQSQRTRAVENWNANPDTTDLQGGVDIVRGGGAAQEKLQGLSAQLAQAQRSASAAKGLKPDNPQRLAGLSRQHAEAQRLLGQLTNMAQDSDAAFYVVGDDEGFGGTLSPLYSTSIALAQSTLGEIGTDVQAVQHENAVQFAYGESPITDNPAVDPDNYAQGNEWSNAAVSIDASLNGKSFTAHVDQLRRIRDNPALAQRAEYQAQLKALDWVDKIADERGVAELSLGSGALDAARKAAATNIPADITAAHQAIDTIMSMDLAQTDQALKNQSQQTKAMRALSTAVQEVMPTGMQGMTIAPDRLTELAKQFVIKDPHTGDLSFDKVAFFSPEANSPAVQLYTDLIWEKHPGVSGEPSIDQQLALLDSATEMPKGFRNQIFNNLSDRNKALGGDTSSLVLNGDILELPTVVKPTAIADIPMEDEGQWGNSFGRYILDAGAASLGAEHPEYAAAYGPTVTATELLAPFRGYRPFLEEALDGHATTAEATALGGSMHHDRPIHWLSEVGGRKTLKGYTNDQLWGMLLGRGEEGLASGLHAMAALSPHLVGSLPSTGGASKSATLTGAQMAVRGAPTPEATQAHAFLRSYKDPNFRAAFNIEAADTGEELSPGLISLLTSGGGLPVSPTIAPGTGRPDLYHISTAAEIADQISTVDADIAEYRRIQESKTLAGRQAIIPDDDPDTDDIPTYISNLALEPTLQQLAYWRQQLEIDSIAVKNKTVRRIPGRIMSTLLLGRPGEEVIPGIGAELEEGEVGPYSARMQVLRQEFTSVDMLQQHMGGIPTATQTQLLDSANSYQEWFSGLDKVANETFVHLSKLMQPGGVGPAPEKVARDHHAARKQVQLLNQVKWLAASDLLDDITVESIGSLLRGHLPSNWKDFQDPDDPGQRLVKSGIIVFLDDRHNQRLN